MQDDLDKIIEKLMTSEGIPEHLVPLVKRTLILVFEDGTKLEITERGEMLEAIDMMANGQGPDDLLTYRLIVTFVALKKLIQEHSNKLLETFG